MSGRRWLLVIGLVAMTGLGALSFGSSAEFVRADLVTPLGAVGAGLLFVTVTPQRREAAAILVGLAASAAGIAAGLDTADWLAVGLASGTESALLARMVGRGRPGRPPLHTVYDENRLLLAIGVASLWRVAVFAAVHLAGAQPLTGWEMVVVGASGIAGSLCVLPIFMRLSSRPRSASLAEAVSWWLVVPAFTLLVFLPGGQSELMFGVVTLVAWVGYRAAMWEVVVHANLVATIAVTATSYGVGPVHALVRDSGYSPTSALALGYLFVIACLLCAIPLNVMINEQHLEKLEFSAQRSMLRDVLASAASTIIVATDIGGRITVFNRGAERAFGLSEADALGRFPDFLLSPRSDASGVTRAATAPDFAAFFAALAAERAGEPMDVLHLRPDGERRLLTVTVSPIRTEQGRLTGYLCAAQDITDRAEAERAVRTALEHEQQAVQRLMEVDAVKDQFVATVSHELRTPMASILGYTEVLEDALVRRSADHDLVDFVRRIERNGNRMLDLVQDLLILSRVEADDLEIVPQHVDLREVVTAAAEDLGARFVDRRVRVSLDLPDEPVWQECDPQMIDQVVTNLLTNAVKFTSDGGRVVVRAESTESGSRLTVADTGLGISEADQERLFSRFFRAYDAETRQIQGSGLGLAIVKGIVTVHGGTVTVDSTLGVGSTFGVDLPRRVPSARVAATPAEAESGHSTTKVRESTSGPNPSPSDGSEVVTTSVYVPGARSEQSITSANG